MNISLFAPWTEIFSGLVVGVIFGFLLRKAHVTRFNVIVSQLLLLDFTVMKVILTAIASGSLMVQALILLNAGISLEISSTTLMASLLGGGLFGVGMALMGYCPGTGVGALADGARDMWFGVLGMIAGAGLYAEAYPWILQHIKPASALTKATLAEYFGVSPWILTLGVLLALIALYFFDKRRCCGIQSGSLLGSGPK